jgi:uncharacterized protein DUF5906
VITGTAVEHSILFDPSSIPGALRDGLWFAWAPDSPGLVPGQPVIPGTVAAASHNRPNDHARPFAETVEAATRMGHGIGPAMASHAGELVGCDLDGCFGADAAGAKLRWDAPGAQLEPWANELVRVGGTYTSLSPSETGLRMYIQGSIEGRVNRFRVAIPGVAGGHHGLEIFPGAGFLRETGKRYPGTSAEIADGAALLAFLLEKGYLKERKPVEYDATAEGDQKKSMALVDRLLDEHDGELEGLTGWVDWPESPGGRKRIFDCPFQHDFTKGEHRGDAYIGVPAHGGISAGCWHDGGSCCLDDGDVWNWHDLREYLEGELPQLDPEQVRRFSEVKFNDLDGGGLNRGIEFCRYFLDEDDFDLMSWLLDEQSGFKESMEQEQDKVTGDFTGKEHPYPRGLAFWCVKKAREKGPDPASLVEEVIRRIENAGDRDVEAVKIMGDGVLLDQLRGLPHEFRSIFTVKLRALFGKRSATPGELLRVLKKEPEKARKGEHPCIGVLNEQYLMVREAGHILFYEESAGGILIPMKKEAFVLHTADMKDLREGQKPVPHSTIWMNSPGRRYYQEGFILDPGIKGHVKGKKYNLWQGFGVQPRKGDWSKMNRHLLLLTGSEEGRRYLVKWLAWKFQHPDLLPEVAVFIIGEEGAGKNLLGEHYLLKIFGVHGMQCTSMDQVCGRFNSHLRRMVFVYANEATLPSDENMGHYRSLITDRNRSFEAKGVDIVPNGVNYVALLSVSNDDHIVKAVGKARRYMVYRVDPEELMKLPANYYAELFEELKRGGPEAMLNELLTMDLGDWHPRHKPHTEELTHQRMQSLKSPVEQWIYRALQTGELTTAKSRKVRYVRDGRSYFVPTSDLVLEIERETRKARAISLNEVAGLFRKLGFAQQGWKRPSGWLFPPVEEARKAWEGIYGYWKGLWPEATNEKGQPAAVEWEVVELPGGGSDIDIFNTENHYHGTSEQGEADNPF